MIYKTSNLYLAAYLSGVAGIPPQGLTRNGKNIVEFEFEDNDELRKEVDTFFESDHYRYSEKYKELRARMREIPTK